jgi:hypothetical protein
MIRLHPPPFDEHLGRSRKYGRPSCAGLGLQTVAGRLVEVRHV